MSLKTRNPPEAVRHAATRQQVLEAAGEVFAEVGFREATVREICRRAAANVAAVNYHFGDKEGLYAAVFGFAQQKAFEKYPFLPEAASDAPADKLRAFIRSFLLRIFDNGPAAWFGKMMLREMIEPTAALDVLLKKRLQPMAAQLRHIISEILGCASDDEKTRLCSLSVVSQCVFYQHCRHVISRMFPEQRLDATAVNQLADHICRFSLAALQNLTDSETPVCGPARNRRKKHN